MNKTSQMIKKTKFQKKTRHKLNYDINFSEVRVVYQGGTEVFSLEEAISKAKSEDKDLILINENQNPPIVRIDDYNKFLYDLDKLEKERKKLSNKSQLKEIQLSASISDNDIKTKSKKAIEFLEDGDKVKVVLLMKGREKAHPERGELVILRFTESLSQVGSPESLPKYENGKWIIILKPKKK